MAFNTIISAIRTATEAAGLTFYYDQPLNINEVGKEFPCVLVSDDTSFAPTQIDRKLVEFTVKVFFYDLYQLDDQKAARDAETEANKQSALVASAMTIIRAARKSLDASSVLLDDEGITGFTAIDKTSHRMAVVVCDLRCVTQYDC